LPRLSDDYRRRLRVGMALGYAHLTPPRRPGSGLHWRGLLLTGGGHVPDRVVVFVDYQNMYRSARRTFHTHEADPHWCGQVSPIALGEHLAADSPYDRQLAEIRIYRGVASNQRDPKGYAAARRQISVWTGSSSKVTVVDRLLQYPQGWPNDHLAGERPREKGIDVAMSMDFAIMALRGQYDVGIMFSGDTDLKPSLEFVADLTRSRGKPRAEVAAWSCAGQHNRRLSIQSANLYCHWVGEATYGSIRDNTSYSA